MAGIKIWGSETRRGLLPMVCVKCGEPAQATKEKTFRWCPPVARLLWITRVAMTKSMTVDLPVCDGHQGMFVKKGLVIAALVVGGILVVVGGGASAGGLGNEAGGAALLAALVVGLGLIFAGVGVYHFTGVRPTEITDDTITLAGVSDEFVARLEDDRARDEEDEEDEDDRRSRRSRGRGGRDRDRDRARGRGRDDDYDD